jgi:hypothetical protein
MSFAKTSAKDRPNLVCLGNVEFKEIRTSASGVYLMAEYKIKATDGFDTYDRLLFRPEWLSPRFKPSSLKSQFVYSNNIGGSDGHLSKLQGICGSPEAFAAIEQAQERIFATEEPTEETASQFMESVFSQNAGARVGYVLKQVSEDAGTDDNGKKIRIKLDKYELGEFFYVTDKKLNKFRDMAERNPDKWQCGYDETV